MKKDLKQDDPSVDTMAYKQCVFQLKNSRASNPYTQCKARLGLTQKSFAMAEGLSYAQLQKKEMVIPKVKSPNPNEIAPTIYPKKVKQVAYKTQVAKPQKDPVPEHVKEAKRKAALKAEPLLKPNVPGINPEKWDKCVEDVKAQNGKAKNPYAICTASMEKSIEPGMSYNQLKKQQTEETLRKLK